MKTHSPSNLPHYQYQSLPSEKYIRILRLLPSQSDDEIEVELVPFPLYEAPAYEAMSYCWGDTSDMKAITCSGKRFDVTPSLFNGLRHFRRQDKVRFIWADAICIHEDNVEERSSQVDMMGEIYERAAEVLVYLGEDEHKDAGVALELIRDFNKRMADHYWQSQEAGNAPETIQQFAQEVPLTPKGDPLLDATRWEAAKNLFASAYFTRTWTLQETGLAIRATLFYGEYTISWSQVVQFAAISSLVADLPPPPIVLRTGALMDTWAALWCSFGRTEWWLTELIPISIFSKNYFLSGSRATFLSILVSGRRYNVSDERDHIYAFLGHPTAKLPDGDMVVKADYDRSSDELWRLVASQLIHRTKSLECLLYIQHALLTEMDQGSWIPKWRTHDHYITDLILDTYSAGSVSEKISLDYQAPIGTDLRLSILKVDRIQVISPLVGRHNNDFSFHFHPSIHSGSSIPNISNQHAMETMWYMVDKVKLSPYNDRNTSFIRTLTAGEYAHNITAVVDFLTYVEKKCSAEFYAKMQAVLLPDTPGFPRRNPWWRFVQNGAKYCVGRRFFVTENGYFGLAPHFADEKDIVAVLLGARVPFVLRPTEADGGDTGRFKLVGPTYLEGIMYGESLKDWEEGRLKHEEVVLV